jgi:deferrochelatase/peroxidase EfeB
MGNSFTDGIDPVRRTLLSGLFFIAFARDPQQFIDAADQARNARRAQRGHQHIGSGIFAVPGGVTRGGHWGDGLFS